MKLRDTSNCLFIPEARVAKDYFNTGLYERGYINWSYDNYAKEDKEIIDIGAHIGMYTVKFANKVKRVHSFECSPKSYNYLCANIALQNQSYKVTTHNVALSDKEGVQQYYIRDPNDGGGNGISSFENDIVNNIPCIDVPTKTLDSYSLTNINFIKIDVEGHEEYVLRGAVKTIEENNHPTILFESWPERLEANNIPAKKIRSSLFTFLESLEYKIVQVQGGTDDMFVAERSR